jgi:plastocyanin
MAPKTFAYAAGCLALLVACSSKSSSPDSNEDAGADAPFAPESASVSVELMLMVPEEVRVKAGGTVSFLNMDSIAHRLVDGTPGDAEAGAVFDSDVILAPNGFVPFSQFEVTFPDPGVVSYSCTEHPNVTKGRVIVQ